MFPASDAVNVLPVVGVVVTLRVLFFFLALGEALFSLSHCWVLPCSLGSWVFELPAVELCEERSGAGVIRVVGEGFRYEHARLSDVALFLRKGR